MLDIYMESDKEVISFCESLFQINKKIELHWKTHEEWGNHLQIEMEEMDEESLNSIARALVDVFMVHRLSKMIRSVITEVYYYTDTDDIEKILDLTHWIITGGDDEKIDLSGTEDPGLFLESLFITMLKNSWTIHYDSLVKFRIKPFKELIKCFTGLAIDELKREEDHQSFVNTLREFIAKKKSLIPTVYMLQGDPFTFFHSNGKRFTNIELQIIMQKEPLYMVGLDSNERNLSPLIAMAPESINIYGDNPVEPKTLTIINVFQERVKFEPMVNFPFPQYLKKLK
ncbi:sporulation protein YtxC [Virgibacillus flavescens]|uniref:sporulation protein YtxC n=1 Tax=Virgibacillus flavescens TaxID=1611422 RepID=UPI003D328EBA